MKRIIIGFFAILFLVIAGLVAVAMMTPKEVYKTRIEAAAAEALGREVSLNGDVGLSFFPQIAAKVEDVTVANPEGFTSEHMIKAGALRGAVKWGPLFAGRVEVQEIAFIDATVDLEVLSDGRANWEFETGQTDAPEPTEEAETSEINAGVERARLVNAALTYRDATTDTVYTLSDLNVSAAVKSLDQALTAEGDGVFDGDAFAFDLTLDSPQAILDGAQAAAKATFRMALIEASFDGTTTLGETPSVSGNFSADIPDIKALAEYAKVDPASLPVALGPLGRASTAGSVSGPLDALALDFTNLDVKGEAIGIAYTGKAVIGETQTMNGAVQVNIDNTAATLTALGLDIPEAATLEGATVSLRSNLSGSADAITADNVDLAVDGRLLNATYKGSATTGDATVVDGRLTLNSSDLHALILATGTQLEASQTDPLKGASLNLQSGLKGPADAISASDIDLALSGPLLNATYKGDVALAGNGSINGQLNANSDNLRGLLEAAAIEMTPGETLQSFKVSGNASGTFSQLAVNGLDLAVDNIVGKGDLKLRTDTPRPLLTGQLTTGPLDLTPFLGEPAEDQPTTTGWSKEPMAMDSLKTVDADIQLSAPSIKIDKINLQDASLNTKLSNGILDANIDQFKVFGGLWKGGIDLNASGGTPTLKIAMTGDSILMQDIMKTFVGNDLISAGGQFKLDVTARGNSLHAIMNSMNGELSANLADGALKGINIGQLIRTASDLRSTLSSGGNFGLSLSPSAQSDFSSFNSVLKIRNGVADIELMEMISSTFGANGLGEISLGQQTLDMALRVAADTAGRGELKDVQVNNIGIPLRITGDWTSPRIVPDTSVLTELLAGQALDRFGNLISGNSGGAGGAGDTVKNVLSGVIGNQLNGDRKIPPPVRQVPTDPNAVPPQTGKDDEKEPEKIEDVAKDAVEDIAKDALGGLFGRKRKD